MKLLTHLILLWSVIVLVNGDLTTAEKQKFTDNSVTITDNGNHYTFSHSGLPGHAYGPFPNADNPNTATSQNHQWTVPKTPVDYADGETKGCLRLGTIGYAISGIPFYNPYTSTGFNAVSGDCSESFDSCNGHPDNTGTYHYHQLSSCIFSGTGHDIVGVAIDGNPIYGPYDENGNLIQESDLDECHGRMYNGRYQYHITGEFPYVLGCYHSRIPPGNSRKRRSAENMFGYKDAHPPSAKRKMLSRTKRDASCDLNCQGYNDFSWSQNICYADCSDPFCGCASGTEKNVINLSVLLAFPLLSFF